MKTAACNSSFLPVQKSGNTPTAGQVVSQPARVKKLTIKERPKERQVHLQI